MNVWRSSGNTLSLDDRIFENASHFPAKGIIMFFLDTAKKALHSIQSKIPKEVSQRLQAFLPAQGLPNCGVRKTTAVQKTSAVNDAKPASSAGPGARKGRQTTGKFATRSELEAFVAKQARLGVTRREIAEQSAVSVATVGTILRKS
jgi:hypothetical protein